MTRVIWGKTGERFFEAGVDRGMLYVGAVGVAWPGLVSVEERPIGGTAKAYYYEGDKYANISSREEYEATIAAFSAPPEFAACDGTTQIASGLYITQQPRVPFDFSYRTRVGNDVDSTDHAYKIHLVYNALAAPASRTHSTLTDDSAATELSWAISTLPPSLSGHRSTSHLVIDSRATDPVLLADIEDILYGSSFLMPRIPQPEEMALLFGQPSLVGRWLGTPNASASELVNGRTGEVLGMNIVTNPRATNDSSWSQSWGTGNLGIKTMVTSATPKRTNLVTDPRGTSTSAWDSNLGSGGSKTKTLVTEASDGPVLPDGTSATTYVRYTVTAAATANPSWIGQNGAIYPSGPYPPGTYLYSSLYVRSSAAATMRGGCQLRRDGQNVSGTAEVQQLNFTIPADTWTKIWVIYRTTVESDDFNVRAIWDGGSILPVGATVDVTLGHIETISTPEEVPYFDGAMSSVGGVINAWTGTANASTSTQAFNDGPILPDGTQVGTYARYTYTSGTNASSPHFGFTPKTFNNAPELAPPGEPNVGAIYVRVSRPLRLRAILSVYKSDETNGESIYGPFLDVAAGEWIRLAASGVSSNGVRMRLMIIQAQSITSVTGTIIDVTCAMAEPNTTEVLPFFDGDTIIS